MYKLSNISEIRLKSCNHNLQKVFRHVSRKFDIRIVCGHRGRDAQEKAFGEGKSNLHFPSSKHNSEPANAIDIAPGYMEGGKFQIDWNDVKAFSYVAGYAMAYAASIGIKLRWGGDWDGDGKVRDNRFNDLPHFEEV